MSLLDAFFGDGDGRVRGTTVNGERFDFACRNTGALIEAFAEGLVHNKTFLRTVNGGVVQVRAIATLVPVESG